MLAPFLTWLQFLLKYHLLTKALLISLPTPAPLSPFVLDLLYASSKSSPPPAVDAGCQAALPGICFYIWLTPPQKPEQSLGCSKSSLNHGTTSLSSPLPSSNSSVSRKEYMTHVSSPSLPLPLFGPENSKQSPDNLFLDLWLPLFQSPLFSGLAHCFPCNLVSSAAPSLLHLLSQALTVALAYWHLHHLCLCTHGPSNWRAQQLSLIPLPRFCLFSKDAPSSDSFRCILGALLILLYSSQTSIQSDITVVFLSASKLFDGRVCGQLIGPSMLPAIFRQLINIPLMNDHFPYSRLSNFHSFVLFYSRFQILPIFRSYICYQ